MYESLQLTEAQDRQVSICHVQAAYTLDPFFGDRAVKGHRVTYVYYQTSLEQIKHFICSHYMAKS